jgi:hypothetical protein
MSHGLANRATPPTGLCSPKVIDQNVSDQYDKCSPHGNERSDSYPVWRLVVGCKSDKRCGQGDNAEECAPAMPELSQCSRGCHGSASAAVSDELGEERDGRQCRHGS